MKATVCIFLKKYFLVDVCSMLYLCVAKCCQNVQWYRLTEQHEQKSKEIIFEKVFERAAPFYLIREGKTLCFTYWCKMVLCTNLWRHHMFSPWLYAFDTVSEFDNLSGLISNLLPHPAWFPKVAHYIILYYKYLKIGHKYNTSVNVLCYFQPLPDYNLMQWMLLQVIRGTCW